MNDCSQNLGPRLRYLNNRITQYMDQQFLALDLTSTQSFLLHHLSLHEQEAVYPKDLEKRFHLTHPTVSGVLQRLEAKNFIIIEPDKADRRCKRIRLTDRARRCDEAVGQAFETLEQRMCAGMTEAEQQTLRRLLDLAEVEAAIQPDTRAIYIETLGNPNSDIPDIDALAVLAHKHGLPLVVDNTFGTPYLIRPIEHGADIVVHSATKFLGGHGTTLGGIIVDGGSFDWAASGKYPAIADPNPSYHGVSFVKAAGPAAFVTYIRAILLRDTGATISPFAAFLLLQGIETLSLRLERHAENTRKVVDFLAHHPQVERVNHPSLPDHPDHALYEKYFPNGGGSIFTFEIKGGQAEAHKFIDNLKIFSLLANVADVKSLVIHPATTTHSQLTEQELADQGIRPNTIRLSIGTEHIDDILADLQSAFEAVR